MNPWMHLIAATALILVAVGPVMTAVILPPQSQQWSPVLNA